MREMGKMLVTSIFSFLHHVFYPSQKEFLLLIHIYYVVCRCFEIRQVWKFVFLGKELKEFII